MKNPNCISEDVANSIKVGSKVVHDYFAYKVLRIGTDRETGETIYECENVDKITRSVIIDLKREDISRILP